MTLQRAGRLAIAIVIALAAFALVLSQMVVASSAPSAMRSWRALRRHEEPVVVQGSDLTVMDGVPLRELVLYAFDASGWKPVPFQVDEVTITGTYVISEDGMLDANDELVFMAKDAGDSALPWEWPDDAAARGTARQVVVVTDPLYAQDRGTVYLYRSPTLTRTATAYVDWNAAMQTLSTLSYTLGFQPDAFVGIADLAFTAGGEDVLDRQKLRGQVTGYLGPVPVFTERFDEETIRNFVPIPPTVTLPIAGPVRAIGGDTSRNFAFYGARADTSLELDLSTVVSGGITIRVDYTRISFDLNEPSASGLGPVTYRDSNGTAAAIDGNQDYVAPSPLATWSEIAGTTGGWVSTQAVSLANGTASNYYRDDATVNPNDTGDGRSYGDSGTTIVNPDGLVAITQRLYFLPPTAGNVGATYASWAANPLVLSVSSGLYMAPPTDFVYLPTVAQ